MTFICIMRVFKLNVMLTCITQLFVRSVVLLVLNTPFTRKSVDFVAEHAHVPQNMLPIRHIVHPIQLIR